MRKPPPKSRPFKAAAKPGRQEAAPPRAHADSRASGSVPPPSVGRALMLYGIHAVTAAWLNPDRASRHLYGTPPALAALEPAMAQAKSQGLKRPAPIATDRETIEKMLPLGAVHQGLALDAEPLPEVNLEDALIAAGMGPASFVLLDQVTDPHNVGAILRSAAALGAKGLIVQTRHAPEVTGVLAKTASGAVEIVPILRETNLSRAIERLREADFFVIGLDERGTTTLADSKFGERVVLALGAEGEGLRRLVAEHCNELVALPTQPPIASLNVSNATAIGLYEIARRRPG